MRALWIACVLVLISWRDFATSGEVCGTAAADRQPKPTAPVIVQLDATPVPGGFDVRVVGAPLRDVPALELSIRTGDDVQRLRFGATAAGVRRELVVRVPVARGGGADVIGQARVHGRGRIATLRLGVAARAPKRAEGTRRTLPDGTVIREVR